MTVTFRVNLETLNRYSNTAPGSASNADNYRETRSTWIPNLLLNNYALKHGDEFTVTNAMQVKYLKDNYVNGETPILTVV